MLEQLLTVDQVVHSWQGTTLMVHESLESAVDGLVEEVEETEEAKEAIARPIGSDEPLTAFELADWPEALRTELMERLVQARVPYVIDTEGDMGDPGGGDPGGGDPGGGDPGGGDPGGGDPGGGDPGGGDPGGGDVIDAEGDTGDAGGGDVIDAEGDTGDAGGGDVIDAEGDTGDAGSGDADGHEPEEVCDLLVREADEERVEVVIDDLLAREEEADFEEMDGLEVNRLLSDLFMACDRLRRDPHDFDGLRGVMAHAPRVGTVRTPFGFAAPNWRNLRNAAGDLLTLVEDEDSDEEDLRELAHRMSDTLRMLI